MQANVFVGFSYEYNKVCLKRFIMLEGNFLYEGLGKNRFENWLQKLHCCESVNRYVDIPFKSIWFRDFSELNLCSEDKVCFIFSKSQSWVLQYNGGLYIKQLRDKNPNCKIILYLWDLISSYYKFDVEFFKKECDAVLSYDAGDAEKYGLIYCPTPYSSAEVADNTEIEAFDVYFCGKAKNRLQDIFKVYLYLKKNNLKCCFFITGVSEKQKKYKEDITYNRRISYYRNLQYVKKAKFILDIIQKNSKGDSLRIKEAVTYGKKIITNNPEVKKNNYYSPENICVFSKVDDISKEFLANPQKANYKNTDFNELGDILAKVGNGDL